MTLIASSFLAGSLLSLLLPVALLIALVVWYWRLTERVPATTEADLSRAPAEGGPAPATGNPAPATAHPGPATGNPGAATGDPGPATGNPGLSAASEASSPPDGA
jgi:hypothetical protein